MLSGRGIFCKKIVMICTIGGSAFRVQGCLEDRGLRFEAEPSVVGGLRLEVRGGTSGCWRSEVGG